MSYRETIKIGEKDEFTISVPIGKKLVFFARTESGQPRKDVAIIADDADSVFQKGRESMVMIMDVSTKTEEAKVVKNHFSQVENSGRCQNENRWFIHGPGFALHNGSGACYLGERPLDVYRDFPPQ